MNGATSRIGIVGARGHVGLELIRLVARHPRLALAFVGSRELDGATVASQVPEYAGDVRYAALDAGRVAAQGAEVVILALPNGMAAPYVAAIDRAAPDTLVVDVSADYRFDDAWFYGVPELYRERYDGRRRISNPGCYATAIQLAVAPMLPLAGGPITCFGVSGYSGAGTTPSERNDPVKLRDNLIPYGLTGHTHEREVTRHLGHPVAFLPHVAAHFRGITLTASVPLAEPTTLEAVRGRYRLQYAAEPLVDVVDDPPWVSTIAGRHHAEVGGFALGDDGRRLVVVATLDNLLKGAATQAMQNVNLALGLDETLGITT